MLDCVLSVIKKLGMNIDRLGYNEIILKSDGEPAILSLKDKVKEEKDKVTEANRKAEAAGQAAQEKLAELQREVAAAREDARAAREALTASRGVGEFAKAAPAPATPPGTRE